MVGSHERSHLFMPHLNELELVPEALEHAQHDIDAIAGESENAAHAPVVQALHEKVAYRFAHDVLAFLKRV
jgi:hypothetical protein